MQNKTFRSHQIKAEDNGVVETIVAVMGNCDAGGDIIHPGAFTKTLAERGGKIRVLDNHRTNSVLAAIGKPIAMRELSRAELPAELLAQYPQATGGLYAKTQFLLDTPEGLGAFNRIKSGAVDEWSIGYDALDSDYGQQVVDGENRTVRNLRTLKLYEYSPVLWGMNPATATLSAKAESKPYGAFVADGGKWCVYKVDTEGNQVGESLGCHATEDLAHDQIAAIYANEKSDNKAGRVLSATNFQRVRDAMRLLHQALIDAGMEYEPEDEEEVEPDDTLGCAAGPREDEEKHAPTAEAVKLLLDIEDILTQ
jgi:phage head maturation protease